MLAVNSGGATGITASDTTVVIPAAGRYTLNVWMREDGVVLDKLWLSTDANAVAKDSTIEGPPESGTAAGGPGNVLVTALGRDLKKATNYTRMAKPAMMKTASFLSTGRRNIDK